MRRASSALACAVLLTCSAYASACCAATARTQAWRTCVTCSTTLALSCTLACATWPREMTWRCGSVSKSSRPNDSKRFSSSSEPKRVRSKVKSGLAMRPAWLACAMSDQLWANRVCTAGLLAKASCTASSMLSGLASSSLLSLLRACPCCSVRLSSSLPWVKALVLSLVAETA